MGMDDWGRIPSSPAGKYFRANIWLWRPIRALCFELGSDLLDDEMLARMSMYVGAGLAEQDTCT